MIFSHRYLRAIETGRISIEIKPDVRKKIWRQLSHFNASVSIQRDPNDRWISHSSILEEVSEEIKTEHAWDFLPGESDARDDSSSLSAMQNLVIDGSAQYAFDIIEMAYVWMESDQKDLFRKKINEIFELYECPWRLSDGELFKLDSDFIGARLAVMAHDTLAGNSFAGAADEYARSRQNYMSGDVKDAIFYAGKSFESVLKVLTNLEHANADQLIKGMAAQGYFDDLPEGVRAGFTDQVLKALPFLRNRLGGHGQGAIVVDIPAVYGELAIQLAAAFHNFLIAKYLLRQTPEPKREEQDLDDMPF